MSQTAIDDILKRIEQLPEEDRVLLEQRLGELVEGQWQREAVSARQEAQRRGLDQAAIDRAVREVRHGQ